MSLGPKTWNATITAVDGDAVTLDVRAKWANYHDGGGLWLPINARFDAASNGRFEHVASTWSIEAPALATGRIRLYADNDYDPHARLYRTLTSVPALELDHPDASPVEAVYDDARPHEVSYPDALGDGCDLLLRMWHARGMRAEHLIRIRKMPTEGHDAIITERIYTPLRIPGWTGTPTEIGGSGAALVVLGDPTLGMRMRPAFAWYYDQAGELITTPISVVVERRVGAGYVMLTKTIPRQFIADALAAGAYVLADETTTTYYPNANAETVSVDGSAARASVEEAFSAIRGGAGNSSQDNATSASCYLQAGSASPNYRTLQRLITLFDTSAIGSGYSVSSATLSIYILSTSEANGEITAGLVSSAPASNTAVANSDYGTFGTTDFATRLSSSTVSLNAYNDCTLNANGLSAINVSGVSKFGLRPGVDIDNGTPPWTSFALSKIEAALADTAGTAKDPKLSVTYTGGGGSTGAGNLLLLGVGA